MGRRCPLFLRRGVSCGPALPGVLVLAVALVGAGLLAAPALALVRPMSLPALTAAAKTVIVAQVVSTDAHLMVGAQWPLVTDVGLSVLEVLKGHADSSLTLRVPGGRVGANSLVVSDAPQFVPGEVCLVFLDAARRVVGWRLGAPPIVGGQVPSLGLSLSEVEAQVCELTGRAPTVFRSLSALASAVASEPASKTASITSVNPATAPAGAGAASLVSIRGHGFGTTPGSVTFFAQPGGKLRAQIASWSDSAVSCWVPVGTLNGADAAASSGPLTLTTSSGARASRPFTVTFAYGGAQWPARQVRYRVDGRFPARIAQVRAAANAWNAAGTPLRFVFAGRAKANAARLGDGYNDITWNTSLPLGVAASTSTWTVGSCILEADTTFNAAYRWGDAAARPDAMDIRTIATHEFGHWLGLRDLYGAADLGKVMYGRCGAGQMRRALAPDDIRGKAWIYGPGRWDTTRPSTLARPTHAATGARVRLRFMVADPAYTCGAARVTVRIWQQGRLVLVVSFAGVPTNVWRPPAFRCSLGPGTYTYQVLATDLAGNRQRRAGSSTLTIG